MIDTKLQQAINEQINWELYSSYLYLSMSAHYETEGLPGLANWFRIQAQEELTHAMKFFDYLAERGGKPNLTAIDGPKTEWESPLAAFEEVLHHEQFVTKRCNALMDLAIEINDHAAKGFLQWFVDEQVEEEASVEGLLNKLKLVGGQGQGLFFMDQELGSRSFTPPAE